MGLGLVRLLKKTHKWSFIVEEFFNSLLFLNMIKIKGLTLQVGIGTRRWIWILNLPMNSKI